MILITGATGFVGSELARQLTLNGDKIICLKRETSLIPHILKQQVNIEWRNADLLDYFSLKEAFAGVNYVYHCAAMVSFNPADKKKMMKVNVEGTSNLVNICQEMNIKKLVHVSSVAAVGDSKNGIPIAENNHWEFNSSRSAYSISKYESEMEVFRAIAEGLNAVIVNPSIIIGKNAGTEGSGQLFATVRKGLKYYPSGSCGLVAVEDVARSMIQLMNSNLSGKRYLINAENYTYKDLFSQIARGYGLKPPATALKPWMLHLGYLGSKIISGLIGNQTGLTKDTLNSAFKKQNYSNQKIREALNMEFKPINQSISEICQSSE
ncbi:NAD-dependent epimerase/dehydratase family protein [Daejeonella oryzae]|uniref:NAD-dependent epimerase/dehydratase family protein n=1 Tax=Daejeonella oryzae TaxID=1122943 RepID=UPI00041169AA|nr:NAD-dependent epimerase/dehydratase family protein [Daejeonella oryzae]